jgi:hypothetical protein
MTVDTALGVCENLDRVERLVDEEIRTRQGCAANIQMQVDALSAQVKGLTGVIESLKRLIGVNSMPPDMFDALVEDPLDTDELG